MATEGGVREGWNYPSGPRYNETLFRGSATFASAATVVVTLPLPARAVSHVTAVEVKQSTATPVIFTVGNYSGNTFTIYAWQPQKNQSPPAAASVTVTASPFTYTSGTTGPPAAAGEVLYTFANGATVTYTVKRGAITTSTSTLTGDSATQPITLEFGDQAIFTYSVATPTMWTFPLSQPNGTPVAFSNSLTVEWEAWGNCSAGQGY